MMRNSAPQVFAGGWKELQHGVHTTNELPFTAGVVHAHHISSDGMILFSAFSGSVEAIRLRKPWIVDDPIPETLQVFSIPSVDARGITFSPDGTTMVLANRVGDFLFQYTLPIPWNILSIVDAPTSLPIPITGDPFGVKFSRDGDFIFCAVGFLKLVSFPLPTNFDITSNVTFTVSPDIVNLFDVAFKPEGDMMYAVIDLEQEIKEFNLPTPYDITNLVATGEVLDTSPDIPKSITAKANGMDFFIVSISPNSLMKFHLEDEWKIATGSHFGNNTPLLIANSRGLAVRLDGFKFYIVDTDTQEIVEYSTPKSWNSSMMTKNGNVFDVSLISGDAMDIQWNHEGTHCYYITATPNVINQLDASTPYDTSTLSDPGVSYTVIEGAGVIDGFHLLPDEKKFYVLISEDVFEYDMPSKGDLASSVFSGNSIDITSTSPDTRIFDMKPDGSQFYVFSRGNLSIDRYTLRTHKDISSAVFADSLDISSEDSITLGLVIRPTDGKKLYAIGILQDEIDEWDLLPDISIPADMSYEDGNVMEYEPDWINPKFLQRIPRTIQVGQIPSTQTDFTLLINNTFPDMIGAVEAEIRFAGSNNIELEYYIQEFDTITGKLIARVITPTISDGDAVFIYFNNTSAIDEQDPLAVWTGMDFVYPFDESTSTVNNLVGVNSTSTGTTQVDGKIFKAINFANNTQFVGFTSTDWEIQRNNTSFSMAFWYKSTDSDRGIFFGNFATISVENFNIEMHTSRLRIFIDDTSGFGTNEFSSTDSKFMDGEWHLLVFTYSGVSRIPKIYFDGVLEISAPARPDNSDIFFEILDTFFVSRDSRTTVNYVGDMELLRKFNNLELDADTISTMYNNENDDDTFWSTSPVESVPTPTMEYE